MIHQKRLVQRHEQSDHESKTCTKSKTIGDSLLWMRNLLRVWVSRSLIAATRVDDFWHYIYN